MNYDCFMISIICHTSVIMHSTMIVQDTQYG